MKKIILSALLALVAMVAHAQGSKILVTYFSWSNNTKALAEAIQQQTGADIYRIEPLVPYTTNYNELAYTISSQEKETNARPALKDTLATLNDYDIIFVGCPVWWFDAPMIIHSFLECSSYNFAGKTVIPFESIYRTYAETTDAQGLEASRGHRAIGGFSMGAVTTWYAFDETLALYQYYLPMSGDCWSLGAFAGMNRPDETARYLAQRITEQGYGASDFYIWAASGTSDSAYSETLLQIRGMARLSEMFTLSNMTFHEKDGARHEYRPMAEYVYNALTFFFPPSESDGLRETTTDTSASRKIFNARGVALQNPQRGLNIIGGQRVVRR